MDVNGDRPDTVDTKRSDRTTWWIDPTSHLPTEGGDPTALVEVIDDRSRALRRRKRAGDGVVGGRLTRRRLLHGVAIVGVAAVAGCVGDDDDDDDETPTPDEDDPTPTPDGATPTPGATPPDEEPTPTPVEGEELQVEGDITSMVTEIYVREENAAGEILMEAELQYHWDWEQERAMQLFDLISEGVSYEIYHIDNTMYQVFDDMCQQIDDIEFGFGDSFVVEDPGEIDDTEYYYRDGTTEFRGQTVEVWALDVESAPWIDDGWFAIYIDPDTNHLVGIEGEFEYETHEGEPRFQFIEQHFHSFNESLDIEVPEVCLDD